MKKNLVLIIADALRADAAASRLDFLRDGLVFEQCWSVAGATYPAFWSLWTGSLPSGHGAVRPYLLPQKVGLADMAAETHNVLVVTENPYTRSIGHYMGNLAHGAGFRYIEENLPPDPYCVIYHCMRTHHPYKNHPPGVDISAINRSGECDEATVQALAAAYDSGVRELADSIGALMENHPDATVILTADHGEAFWEHGFLAHIGNRMVPELLHVPLVVADGAGHKVVKKPVSVCEVPHVLRAALAGKRYVPPGRVLCMEDYQYDRPVVAARYQDWVAVNDGDKILYYSLRSDPGMHSPRKPSKKAREIMPLYLAPREVWGPTQEEEASGEVVRRLKELGYVE